MPPVLAAVVRNKSTAADDDSVNVRSSEEM